MAITDKFNGSKSALIINDTTSVVITTLTHTIVTGAGYSSVGKIVELGTIQNEANVIDVPEFGQDYAGKLIGQLNAGTIDMMVAWDPSNAQHSQLKDAVTNKTLYTYTIQWNDGTGTNFEYVGFNAYAASFGIETSIDDAVKASVSLAIDGGLFFFAN